MGDNIDMSHKKSPCVQNYKYTTIQYSQIPFSALALGAGVT